MDIEILLYLQEFRNGTGGFLPEFLSGMTFPAEINTAVVITAILHRSAIKEPGTCLLTARSGNRLPS